MVSSPSHRTSNSTSEPIDPRKFRNQRTTVDGLCRASVEIHDLETVWFNTGTLCNIECLNCYVESSPSNDRLEYLSAIEVRNYLDEISDSSLPVREIGFTGGEPFMNPQFIDMAAEALERSFDVLVLTNAMRPMMRPRTQARLLSLAEQYGDKLHIRVSVDHHLPELHESERGEGSWSATLSGLRWLATNGFHISVAGRKHQNDALGNSRAGYATLFRREKILLDANDPNQLVLFPEMDSTVDIPEITVDCWHSLGVEPSEMMCARSRMVVKRRGADSPTVVACTLLPYEREFELGTSLHESLRTVWLNHPHCATFCVLGGGSCSAGKVSRS
jgi:hypothetical protein